MISFTRDPHSMLDRLAFTFLWLAVFSLPWEDIVALPGMDPTQGLRASRILGMLAFGLMAAAVVSAGRIRVPGRFQVLALLFLLWASATVFWSIDRDATIERAITYAQLVLLAWLIWQLARTEPRQLSLYQAYVFGAQVSAIGTILSFGSGHASPELRYAAGDFNANDLGFTLVLAIPMAWYLALRQSRGLVSWLNRLYLPVGTAAAILTASRGAFVPALFALLIVPWTLRQSRFSVRVAIVLLLASSLYVADRFIPETTWERLATTRTELATGTLTRRRDIWRAGMQVFSQHPMVGVGAGTFTEAAAPYLDRPRPSHNTYISVLVEQGVVGLSLFVMLFAAAMLPIRLMHSLHQRFWVILAGTLIIGLAPRNWDYRKATWFVLGTLAAEGAALIYLERERALAGRTRPAIVAGGNGRRRLVNVNLIMPAARPGRVTQEMAHGAPHRSR